MTLRRTFQQSDGETLIGESLRENKMREMIACELLGRMLVTREYKEMGW